MPEPIAPIITVRDLIEALEAQDPHDKVYLQAGGARPQPLTWPLTIKRHQLRGTALNDSLPLVVLIRLYP